MFAAKELQRVRNFFQASTSSFSTLGGPFSVSRFFPWNAHWMHWFHTKFLQGVVVSNLLCLVSCLLSSKRFCASRLHTKKQIHIIYEVSFFYGGDGIAAQVYRTSTLYRVVRNLQRAIYCALRLKNEKFIHSYISFCVGERTSNKCRKKFCDLRTYRFTYVGTKIFMSCRNDLFSICLSITIIQFVI